MTEMRDISLEPLSFQKRYPDSVTVIRRPARLYRTANQYVYLVPLSDQFRQERLVERDDAPSVVWGVFWQDVQDAHGRRCS